MTTNCILFAALRVKDESGSEILYRIRIENIYKSLTTQFASPETKNIKVHFLTLAKTTMIFISAQQCNLFSGKD